MLNKLSHYFQTKDLYILHRFTFCLPYHLVVHLLFIYTITFFSASRLYVCSKNFLFNSVEHFSELFVQFVSKGRLNCDFCGICLYSNHAMFKHNFSTNNFLKFINSKATVNHFSLYIYMNYEMHIVKYSISY